MPAGAYGMRDQLGELMLIACGYNVFLLKATIIGTGTVFGPRA